MWFLALTGLATAAGLDKAITVRGPAPGAPIVHAQPAGDMDGDGLGDLVFGVPGDDTNGDEAGAAYLVFDVLALDPAVPLVDQSHRMLGEEAQDAAGREVAALGDVDGDGYADVAVSAPEATWQQTQTGKVYVIYGRQIDGDGYLGDLAYIHGVENSDRVGSRVFGVPDLDGDGRDEMLLGVPYSNPAGDAGPGWMALLYGRASRWPDDTRIDLDYDRDSRETTADAAWVANDQLSFGGRAATVIPDITDDGLPEIVFGAPGYELPTAPDDPDYTSPGAHAAAGAIFLYDGKTREAYAELSVYDQGDAIGTVSGSDSTPGLPWILGTLADGRIIASSPEANTGRGAVMVLELELGDHLYTEADLRWDGDSIGDALGTGLAVSHGLDGGSLVAAGEPGWDLGRGRVRLLGPDGWERTLEGCAYEDLTGYSVRSHPGPDPWGEDRGWVGITAPGNGWYQGEEGYAYLVGTPTFDVLGEPCDPEDIVPEVDRDGDGSPEGEDCDDLVAWAYPGAPEVCGNEADDDCDGEVDESCGDDARGGGGCATAGGAGILAVLLALGAVRRRRGIAALALLGLAGRAQAQDDAAWRDPYAGAFARLWGSAGWEYLRGPVISGDYDGDGRQDVAVLNYHGAAHYYVAGEVQVIPGAEVVGDYDLDLAPVNLHGGSEHDYLGIAAATVLVDGAPDGLLVGADHSGLTELEQGQTMRFDAPLLRDGWVSAEEAELVLRGDDDADWFGNTVIRAGDLDGDGLHDYAIGALARDFVTAIDDDDTGGDDSGSGGTDAPGDADEAGRVWLLFGEEATATTGASNIPTVASSTVTGTVTRAHVGWRLCAPGDLDGDGRDDLVVGAFSPEHRYAGDVLVYSAVERDRDYAVADAAGKWSATEMDGMAGYGLGCGDLDGDGVGEVVIGAPWAAAAAGRVWVMAGAPQGTRTLDPDADNALTGTEGAWLGYSVAVGPRLLLGAPGIDEVWVTDGDLVVDQRLPGPDFFGATASWMGDIDGDGAADAALVASDASGTRENQGVALLLSGADLINDALPTLAPPIDADGDGATADEDCDDGDPRRAPGFDETCEDAVDNDCDGSVDETLCVKARGCATTGGAAAGWAALAGLLAVMARRSRALAALALTLALAGCKSPMPELELIVPSGTLFDTVELQALGNYDRLAILVDGEILGGGPGPTLEVQWDTATVPDGAHTVRAIGYLGAADPVEKVVDVEVRQVAGDLTAPVVRFDSPADGGTYAPDEVVIVLDATDDVGIASAAISANDVLLATLPPEGPYELLWENIPDGEYVLTGTFGDLAGNVTEASISILVTSLSELTCSITRPDDGDTVSGTVNVTVAASSRAGVTRVDFYADDVLFGTDTASSWQYEWDATPYDGQTVTLKAVCTAADGVVEEASISVTVDEDAGGFAVTITQPSDGGTVSGASVPVRAAVGGGEGAAAADLYVDGVLVQSLTASPWQFTWDSTTVANGAHTLEVIGTELNTGATASDRISVTVAN